MIKSRLIYIFFVIVMINMMVFIFIKTLSMNKVTSGDDLSDDLDRGKTLFTEYCSSCHGEKGDGKGELAYLLFPKPRDFNRGTFKLRSTPSGQVPTDGDLTKTIKNGMPGTAMPSFYYLEEDKIKDLVNYVKELSQDHFKNQTPISIKVPAPLASSPELVEKGKKLYTDLGCQKCHGDFGKGDGEAASSLKDSWEYPIKVRDFTQGVYLGGGNPEDLYLRFVTGLGGTPMPSYESSIQELGAGNEEEKQKLIWGLVYFVKGLETHEAKKQKFEAPMNGIITAKKSSAKLGEKELLNTNLNDWAGVQPSYIPVSRLWQKDVSNLKYISVKSIYNEEYVAIRMEWNDKTKEEKNYKVQDFMDAAAVQCSKNEPPGFHGMGSEKNPVNIWYWKSEWQMRVSENKASDITYAYSSKVSDMDVLKPDAKSYEYNSNSGKQAGNIVSGDTVKQTVENTYAKGAGTLTSSMKFDQDVKGNGQWDGNKWSVVFVRKLKSNSKDGLQIDLSKPLPVGFAVWDGASRDRNGQKMVSTWYKIKF